MYKEIIVILVGIMTFVCFSTSAIKMTTSDDRRCKSLTLMTFLGLMVFIYSYAKGNLNSMPFIAPPMANIFYLGEILYITNEEKSNDIMALLVICIMINTLSVIMNGLEFLEVIGIGASLTPTIKAFLEDRKGEK